MHSWAYLWCKKLLRKSLGSSHEEFGNNLLEDGKALSIDCMLLPILVALSIE